MSGADESNVADIIVIGSGAAGLTAALTAADQGQSVIVLERSDKIGGTTVFSGALLWAPLNPKRHEIGVDDSREEALDYIRQTVGGPLDEQRAAAFVDNAAETIQFVEQATDLTLVNCPYPDSFVETTGGKAHGRHLEPAFYPIGSLGRAKRMLRTPFTPPLISFVEMLRQGFLARFPSIVRNSIPKIAFRIIANRRSGGLALVAGLLKACLKRGVRIELNARARELEIDADGRVCGVSTESQSFHARRAVILACGGFEHDEALAAQHIPAPLQRLASPPGLAGGDNVRLAEQAGAHLENMQMYWNWPASATDKSVYEGRKIGLLMVGERTLPHSLWINAHGERFCNESAHNVAYAFEQRDSRGAFVNQPAWSIMDSQFRRKYPIMYSAMPGSKKDPAWLIKAESLDELADKLGVPAAALKRTIERFNAFAREGDDQDFDRGKHAYERTLGDTRAPHPNLGTLEQAPYYALPVYASAVGTRGGARTDEHGRVTRADNSVVPGLYGAGNAVASFVAPNIMGGGATIMPAMTFGRRAALHAARTNL